MPSLVLAVAGLVALVAAAVILRTFGPSYRVARLIATTQKVSVAEARRLATDRRPSYVRVDGRIDSEEDFEGPDHQPLVLRRVRLEALRSGRWQPFEDHRQAVPFTINEGLDAIAVDIDSLDRGLVVVPRESVGTAADLAGRVPEGTPPGTRVRARIDQLSSVEHAIVCGTPIVDASGAAVMTAGRGRPLVLTVLEPDEAMRVLAAGGRRRTKAAAALLGAGALLLLGAAVWTVASALLPAVATAFPPARAFVAAALAASPQPSAVAGDPRSNGQGPGLVGTPGLAILGVAAIAILSIVVTTLYVRFTAGSQTSPTDRGTPQPPATRRSDRP
ncbi:MAG: hypothetical protein ACJ77F_09735 [Chloroflexota bacterium]